MILLLKGSPFEIVNVVCTSGKVVEVFLDSSCGNLKICLSITWLKAESTKLKACSSSMNVPSLFREQEKRQSLPELSACCLKQ
jgi:hypothetical protein